MKHGVVALAALVTAALVIYDPGAPAALLKSALLGMVALLAIVVVRRSATRGVTPALYMWAAWIGWGALTILWGSPQGVRELWPWASALALAVGLRGLRRAEARALVHLVATGVVAVVGVWVLLCQLGDARPLWAHGGQGNPDWAGLCLCVALPLAIDAARTRPVAIAAVLVALPALWGCGSRTALVALVLGGAGAFVVCGRHARRQALVALVALTVVIGVGIALSASARAALAGRAWIMSQSATAAVTALPWGVGLGRFGDAFLDAQAAALATLTPEVAARRFVFANHAHDEWLQTLVVAGPLGLVLLIAAFVVSLRAAARAEWLAGVAALLVCAVAALGDMPLQQPAVIVLVVLVVAATRGSDDVRATAPIVELGAALAAGLAVALAIASDTAERARTAARDALPEPRERLLARAARLDPRSSEIALEHGLAYGELGMHYEAQQEIGRALVLAHSVGGWVALGNERLALGELESAIVAYQVAVRADPGSFRARVNLADALLRHGVIVPAEQQLAVAAALYPTHPAVAELRARLRSR